MIRVLEGAALALALSCAPVLAQTTAEPATGGKASELGTSGDRVADELAAGVDTGTASKNDAAIENDVASEAAAADDAATAAEDGTSEIAGMDDSTLLGQFVGKWSGRGKVLPKIDGSRPFNVKCDFDLTNEGASSVIDGECGALFIKRPVRVTLALDDGQATGTYDAKLRTGVADLSGEREGDVIDMTIMWNGEVNGDLEASMRIETGGTDTLRLLITD